MTTQAELMVKIARALRDTSNKTFSENDLRDFIADGLNEIGDTAPERFQENLEITAGTYDYPLRSDLFENPSIDIELSRVELWTNETPPLPVCDFTPGSNSRIKNSQAGWYVFNGVLSLTRAQVAIALEDTHVIRVWGFSPYAFAGYGPVLPAAGDAAIASTNVITTTSAHGLVAGNRVRVVSITGGVPLVAGTDYYVVAPVTPTTFKVSETDGGAVIDITTDSSAIVLAVGGDGIIVPLSSALTAALVAYARKEGMERLNMSRELFTQWQTQSNNSDVSPAALMNALTLARDEWRRLSRKLVVLRDSQ